MNKKHFNVNKNMKRNILLGILACLCYWSCFEDEGTYNYGDFPVNKVTISTSPTVALLAVMGDTFRYSPKITFENTEDTLGFEYWWELRGGTKLEIVCNTRELIYLPRAMGNQSLQICVKETRSGIITSAGITINAAGTECIKGWLILSSDEGESKLSFVRPDRSIPGNYTSERNNVPFLDLYNRIFPNESLGRNPIALRQAYSNSYSADPEVEAIKNVFYVLQENESVCLHGSSYEKKILLANEFTGGTPAGFAPLDYYHGQYSSMVLNADGKVYYRSPPTGISSFFFTYSFANFPMEYEGKVLIIDRILRAKAERCYHFAVYDKENKRFLWIYAGSVRGNGTILRANPAYNAAGTFLDYNNTGDAEIIYTVLFNERASGLSSAVDLFTLYSKEGDTYAQKSTSSMGQNTLPTALPVAAGLTLTATENKVFSGKAFITPDTKYYMLKTTRGYLFFATGGTLYWYQFSTNITYPFYTFAGDEVIAMSSNPVESELGVLLKSGKFVTLNIAGDHLTSTDDHLLYEIDIPGDKMIDLDYKFDTYAAYLARTRD
jgi:hypothetical protein